MSSFRMSLRYLEVLLFLCFVCGVISGTFMLIFNRRENLLDLDQMCGPSHQDFSVDITKRSVQRGGGFYWKEEGIFFPPGTFWKNPSGNVFGCPCLVKKCVRKCCQKDKEFDEFDICDVSSSSSVVEDYVRSVCPPDSKGASNCFILRKDITDGELLHISQKEEPSLLPDGRLFVKRVNDPYLNQGQYCFDSFNNTLTFLERHSLSEPRAVNWLDRLKVYAMMISVPFLLLTLLVYSITPALRNLHGKLLMCNISCLTLSYISNSVIQLQWIEINDSSSGKCLTVALVLQFAFLGTFFWLNVMSFDIWLIFSDLSSSCNPKAAGTKFVERRKFMLYSMYAWGSTVAITAVAWFMDRSPLVPEYYVKPQFGVNNCWHNGNDARVLYSYLPSGVLLGLNCLMFTSTAYRLWCHTSNAKMLSSGCGGQKFSLYGKLFMVMGLNWVMELASFVLEGNDYIWIISDLGNTLQGLIIFYLFICKKTVLKQLKDRFCPDQIFGSKDLPSFTSRNTRSSNLCCSRPTSTCVRVNADVPLTCLSPSSVLPPTPTACTADLATTSPSPQPQSGRQEFHSRQAVTVKDLL